MSNNKNLQNINQNNTKLNKNVPTKKYSFVIPKHLLSPTKIQKQKILFNRSKFGNLKFFLKITYKMTNVFYIFYCKAEKYPTKVFNFFKQSTGIENRDKIRVKKAPSVNLRGRKKLQFQTIINKLNLVKSYIYDFIKVHPEMVAYKRLHMIWDIYKLDFTLQNLLNQSFEFSYSINVIERIIKEKIKNEVLHKLNLRKHLNLTDHEIIQKFYNRNNKKSKVSEDFVFKGSKKKRYLKLRNKLVTYFSKLSKEEKILKLKNILKSKILDFENYYKYIEKFSNTIHLKKLRNYLIGYKKRDKKKDVQKIVKDVVSVTEISQNKTKLEEKLEGYLNILEKTIEIDPKVIEAEQLVVLHKFNFKFPHNGCRPKKARRLKRTNK